MRDTAGRGVGRILRMTAHVWIVLLLTAAVLALQVFGRSEAAQHLSSKGTQVRQERSPATMAEQAFAAPIAAAPAVVLGVPPAAERYLGAHLDWTVDSPAAYDKRSGLRPRIFAEFALAPITDAEQVQLRRHALAARAVGAAFMLTLEPRNGLASINAAAARRIAKVCAQINADGSTVYLRFAHEMNGSWYSWGEQPTAYIATYRAVAKQVHATARLTRMVWAPNQGSGYPYSGGPYEAHPGQADFALLDTDHDRRLTMHDDPYLPYYPGDDAVDWVGLTLYYFGHAWPWGENEMPEPTRFADSIAGTYRSGGVNETALPNFYQEIAVAHHKPMMISETAALFNTASSQGAQHLAISSAWTDQVFSSATARRFPRLAMINWFEFRKKEQGVTGLIDWRATADSLVLRHYRVDIAAGRMLQANVR